MNYLNKFETNLAYHFSEVLNYPFAKPYWIYISLSHKCTYNCRMCGVVKILKGYELPKEVVKKAFDDIYRWHWDRVVVLTGGEPFLRKDIFEVIDYSVKRRIKTEVISNGCLINEELASKIISSGLRNIAISLDGAKKSTHDFIREKGSYSKTLRAIKNLVNAKRKNGGKKIHYEYIDKNRKGDHIWWITDNSKFKNRYPGWNLTFSISDIVEDIYKQQNAQPQCIE